MSDLIGYEFERLAALAKVQKSLTSLHSKLRDNHWSVQSYNFVVIDSQIDHLISRNVEHSLGHLKILCAEEGVPLAERKRIQKTIRLLESL